MNQFKILKKDKSAGRRTKARLGVLTTPHGIIKTPSYVFVGTYGKFLHLSPNDLKKTNSQIFIANTFHLWKTALQERLQGRRLQGRSLLGGRGKSLLIKKLGLNIPTMTDSGGFQVLSLAFSDKNKVGKFMTGTVKADSNYKRTKIRITEKGVYFKYNSKWKFLGPELSMKLQRKIGADIIFAFDHITSPLDTYKYNQKALRLTEKWAKICLKEHAKNQKSRLQSNRGSSISQSSSARGKSGQQLFGIVQGGLFKDLRIQSAKSIGSMPFDGFGIGGSYTKKQIAKVLKWVIPHLPEEKPRHLLGVGKVEDIFEAIENGIDTFDCVIPTREARHGRLYTKTGHLDIRRGYFSKDKPGSRFFDSAFSDKAKPLKNSLPGKKIEPGCKCPTCSAGIPRWKIRELIKSKDRILNAQGQRWCLIHNMWFFNKLLEDIRNSIAQGKFIEFKKKFLANYI